MYDAIQSCGSTVTLSPTTSSVNASITFPSNVATPLAQVVNDGPDGAMIRGGTGTQTAVTTDLYIQAGQTRDVIFPAGTNNVAAICPTSSASVKFSPIYKAD